MGGSGINTIKGDIDIQLSCEQTQQRRMSGAEHPAEYVFKREADSGRPDTTYTYRQTGRDLFEVFKSKNSNVTSLGKIDKNKFDVMFDEKIRDLKEDDKDRQQDIKNLKNLRDHLTRHFPPEIRPPMPTPPQPDFSLQRPVEHRTAPATSRPFSTGYADLNHSWQDAGRYPPITAQMLLPPGQRAAHQSMMVHPDLPRRSMQVDHTTPHVAYGIRPARPNNPQPYFAGQSSAARISQPPHPQTPRIARAAVQAPPLPPRPLPAPAPLASNNPYRHTDASTTPRAAPGPAFRQTAPVLYPPRNAFQQEAETRFAQWIHDSSGKRRDIVHKAVEKFWAEPGLIDESARYHQRERRLLPPDRSADIHYQDRLQRIAAEVLDLR